MLCYSNICEKNSNYKGPNQVNNVIMQEISTFVILRATSTDRQTGRLHIFNTFAFIWHHIIHLSH